MKSTRRVFLRSAGLTSLGATAVGSSAVLAAGNGASATTTDPAAHSTVPFYGTHQAGIATPAQNDLQFVALDMVSNSVGDLRRLLQRWSTAAARMTRGELVGSVRTGNSPPKDTGEAVGLGPADLTITFGLGPSLFGTAANNRFGLAHRRPAPLVDLPHFLGDDLQPAISGGDLAIQACANNQQVAFHAVHELMRLAIGIAKPRWLLAGAGRTANSRSQPLPRNLMGFQDGTANIKVEETSALREFVWAHGPASPGWMHGGSYLVARRIEIALGLWDETGLASQEQTIGRHKLGGGLLRHVPPNAHLLLASPGRNNGQRLLRRGYSYTDGIEQGASVPAAGLMFLCFQADPRRQFIPIQRRIAGHDALSLYLRHVGSAIFACPPGAKPGGYVGESLLG
jgi:deferrochelatase/peroxidase EfeB